MKLELVKQKAQAGERDTNTYNIQVKDRWTDIGVSFDAIVNMPYQYWIEMHEFWADDKEKLDEQNGDVIKRVLLSYANVMTTWLITKEYWQVWNSEFIESEVNKMFADREGYESVPNLNIKNIEFDFDTDLTIIDFKTED